MTGQTQSVAIWYTAENGQFDDRLPQRNVTVITTAWPSVSESILRVRLGITVFYILALPRVTLWITAKKVNISARHLICRI